jgi:hypothetical protein
MPSVQDLNDMQHQLVYKSGQNALAENTLLRLQREIEL